MTAMQLLALAAALPEATADCPFEGDFVSVVLRHSATRRWFGLLVTLSGRAAVNLKCEPAKAQFWRSVYRDVIPAWHMNKTHWNTVFLSGDVPDEEIGEMLRDSYELTLPGHAKQKK